MSDKLLEQYEELYKELDLTDYSSEELEDFGRRLSVIVVNNIGLLRYHKSKIIYYDLTSTMLGKLTDEVEELIKGITFYQTKEKYIDNINNLLTIVSDLGETIKNKNSVSKNIRKMFLTEIRDMIRLNNQKQYNVW